MRRSVILGALLFTPCLVGMPAQAADHDAILRGVVGRAVSVALPTEPGYRWDWKATGDQPVFGVPYRMRFAPPRGPEVTTPEIWTFPLFRPGRQRLTFTLHAIDATASEPASSSAPAKRVVDLVVLTPYEAQQKSPQDLRDTVLLK